MPNDHAFISPSGLAALEKCPGKVYAEKDYPRSSGPAAIDGTHSHTLREICLNQSVKAESFVGQDLSDHEGTFTVDIYRARRVQMSIDHINKLINELGEDAAYTLGVEQKVAPGKWFDMADEFWGTADTVLDTDKYLLVDDFKDGGQPVYTEDNLQLAAYALGEINDLGNDFPIWMSINQPKVRPDLDIWKTTVGDLKANWLPRIEKIVKGAMDPNAPRVPGDHCKWCLHKPNCKERRAAVSEITNNLMAGIPTPAVEGQVQPQGAFNVPALNDTVSNEELAKYLDYKTIIMGWFKDVEAKAMERAKEGQPIPGHKLVHGQSKRSWIKDQEQVIKSLKNMKLKKADYLEEKLKSFTKILANENLTERQRKRVETDLIVKPAGSLTLVPESDKRKAVTFDVQKTFEAIPAGETPAPETEEPQALSFL